MHWRFISPLMSFVALLFFVVVPARPASAAAPPAAWPRCFLPFGFPFPLLFAISLLFAAEIDTRWFRRMVSEV
jgi:hypothetical protein